MAVSDYAREVGVAHFVHQQRTMLIPGLIKPEVPGIGDVVGSDVREGGIGFQAGGLELCGPARTRQQKGGGGRRADEMAYM